MARKMNLTASMVRAYKSCHKLYEFQYVHLLKPEKTPEALEMGSNYHVEIERVFRGEPTSYTLPGIMARAFDRFIPWREWRIEKIEEEFSLPLSPFLNLVGKIDAICADGTPVEHKSAGQSISPETETGLKYRDKLAWDDQVTIYLMALGTTRVKYTVCQKPSIRLKQNETEEEYLARCEGWYDETKVRFFEVTRDPKELEDMESEIRFLASEIRRRKHFYRNPSHCSLMGCSYASICLNYDPEIVSGFVKKERMSEELCRF